MGFRLNGNQPLSKSTRGYYQLDADIQLSVKFQSIPIHL